METRSQFWNKKKLVQVKQKQLLRKQFLQVNYLFHHSEDKIANLQQQIEIWNREIVQIDQIEYFDFMV